MSLRQASDSIKRILANNIRSFRSMQGISQEDFALKCNLHRTYIGSIEREERNVTLSTLEILAEAIGVSIPVLLTEGSIRNETT